MDKKRKRSRRKIHRSKENSTSPINKRDFGRNLSLYGTVFFFLTLFLLPWWTSVNISFSILNPFIKIGFIIIFILGIIHLIINYFDNHRDFKIFLIISSFLSGTVIALFSGYYFVTQIQQWGPFFSFLSGIGLLYSGYYLFGTKWKPKTENKITDKKRNIPWIIIILISINSIALILVNYVFGEEKFNIIRQLSLISGSSPRWFTLLSSTFLHIDFFHFLSNMIVLWWIAYILLKEAKAQFILFVFIISGIIGSLSCLLIDPRTGISILGASGAIAGLIGLGCVLTPNIICNVPYYILFWCGRLPVRAIWIFAFWILIQSLAAFNLSIGVDGNSAYWAHLGGIISGILCGLIYLKYFAPQVTSENIEDVSIDQEIKLSDKRNIVNKKNSKTLFPQYLIASSLLITLLSVFLSYSSFTIMGRMSSFQLSWNNGSVTKVSSFFKEGSQKIVIKNIEDQLKKNDPDGSIGSVNHKIYLLNAHFKEGRYKVKYLVAPFSVDPYREPEKCGIITFYFYKVNRVWIINAYDLSKIKIKKNIKKSINEITETEKGIQE